MTRWFWIDGRLSWLLIAVVAFFALSLLVTDYAWRVLVMPSETFLMYVSVIDAALAALLIGLYLLFRQRKTSFQ